MQLPAATTVDMGPNEVRSISTCLPCSCFSRSWPARGSTQSWPRHGLTQSWPHYRVWLTTQVLDISGKVRLVGDAPGSTVLSWSRNMAPAPDALVVCGGPGYGRIANLTVMVTSAVGIAVHFSGAAGCALDTVEIVVSVDPAGPPIRNAFSATHSSHFRLSDVSIFHSGNCTASWPQNTAYYVGSCSDGAFENVTILSGCQGDSTDSSQRVVFDLVSAVSVGQDSQGDGFSTFTRPNILQNIYISRGLDVGNPSAAKRWESMTFDGPGGLYFGTADSSSIDPTTNSETWHAAFAPIKNPYLEPVGLAAVVMQGENVGAVARVTNASDDQTTWTVTPPLFLGSKTGAPSVISVVPYRGQILWEANAYLNDTTWQLFGVAIDITSVGNYMQNVTAGMQAWGLLYQGGWQPNYGLYFGDNTLRCSGGLTAISSDDTHYTPPIPFTGPFNRLLLYRRNALLAGSSFKMEDATWDVYAEGLQFAGAPCLAGGPVLPPGHVSIGPNTQRVYIRDD